MPLGKDTQYDLSFAEQDKIRRRLELKNRVKQEGIKARYDPFLHLKKEPFMDPASARYADLRKRGRMPGAPLKPIIFFSTLATSILPIFILGFLMDWERKPFLEASAVGDYPIEKRREKTGLAFT